MKNQEMEFRCHVLLFSTVILFANAAHLRQPQFQAVAITPNVGNPSPPPEENSTETDDRGERGHFYYSDGCEDCAYKAPACGCQPAMEYFACLTKHCHSSKRNAFSNKCAALSQTCTADLDIQCQGPKTVCRSKYMQLPTGGLGLSVEIDEGDAFCGPFGKCIGSVTMMATLHNRPSAVPAPSPAPAPGPAVPPPGVASLGPAPAVPTSLAAPGAQSIWLECGLPVKDNAVIDSKEDWKVCQAQVAGNLGSCRVPMFKEFKLEAGSKKKAYCLLSNGIGGKRLTQPYWVQIINRHDRKTKNKDDAEIMDVTAVTEGMTAGIGSTKLPWMVEKEQRAAAREAAKAKVEETKKVKEDNPKENQESSSATEEGAPPWMEGKKNAKPAPPHEALQ